MRTRSHALRLANLDEDCLLQIGSQLDLLDFTRLRACSRLFRALKRPACVKDTLPADPCWEYSDRPRLDRGLSPNERLARLVFPHDGWDLPDGRWPKLCKDPPTKDDILQLVEVGADVDARFDGMPLTIKLLREELELLCEASVPYNPIRLSDHGCALGAALALHRALDERLKSDEGKKMMEGLREGARKWKDRHDRDRRAERREARRD